MDGIEGGPARFSFSPMDEAAAREVLAWRYPPPYDFYNCAPHDVYASVRTFLDPANGYFAARDGSGAVVGFCCLGPDAQVQGGDYPDDGSVDVGLGLRPDLTGRGLGLPFVQAVVQFGRERLGHDHLRLTVAGFNQRAIRVYERAGFRVTGAFSAGRDWAWVQLALPGE